MEIIALATVTIGWLAMAAIVLWGVVESLSRFLKDDGPLPLFALLEQGGLTMRQVEEAVGMNQLAQAARRCLLCASRSDCDGHPAWCPNEALLRRAKGEGGGP